MRSISLHPASLALGLVLGGIALLSMSQAIVATSPLRIEYAPHPRDMLTIKGGTPYTVPTGKIFVVTALGNIDGSSGSSQIIGLMVNGQRELVTSSNAITSMASIPTGLTAPSGATVELVEVNGSQELLKTRAWGYLAPQ